MKTGIGNRILGIFLIVGMSIPCLLSAQDIVFSATSSADKVGLENQFRLTFEIQNASGVSNFEAPSFSDFQVRGGPFQSQSNSFSNINGQVKNTSSVRVTYILQAKKTGSFIIPPAKIVVNNQTYKTNSIPITVVKGSIAHKPSNRRSDPFNQDPFEAMRQQRQQMQRAMQQLMQQQRSPAAMMPQSADMSQLDEKHLHKNIYIKVEVDNKHPYVGEQITASYKLYTRLPMNMNLTQLPSLNGFWTEDFKIPNSPKPTKEVIDGKTYQVFLLKKSALFPQQSGKLKLDPAKAEGVVRIFEKQKTQDPFADDPRFGSLFMQDPFFNNNAYSGYSYKDVKVKLSSTPVTIDVQPLPIKNQPDDFSGAVGQFKVYTKIDTTVFSTDAPVAVQFIVSGSGNFKLMGNPTIQFPKALNVYDPQIQDSIISRSPTIFGEKVYTYYLSPQQPGNYKIPSIAFSFFNPKTNSYKTIKTQPIGLSVIKGVHYKADKNNRNDIHGIEKKMGAIINPAASSINFIGYWVLYPIALLIFFFLFLRNHNKKKALLNADLWKNKKANKVAWKRLTTARKLLNQKAHIPFYDEVSKAVWLYLSDKLALPLSVLSKENISEKLANRQVEQRQITAVNNLLLECEMALYSPSGGQRQKEDTLEEAVDVIGTLEKSLKTKR